MGEPFAFAAPDASVSKPVDWSRVPVRFQVRPVLWGDRRRYEVVDTSTDTALVVRTTRWGADDDVMVLNLGATGGPRVFAADGPEAEERVGTRQCGRCRGFFPAAPASRPGVHDWWLCEACHKVLIDPARSPTS